jgi:hypothetical protein
MLKNWVFNSGLPQQALDCSIFIINKAIFGEFGFIVPKAV